MLYVHVGAFVVGEYAIEVSLDCNSGHSIIMYILQIE